MIFVDTNVLIYARDLSEADRHPVARDWIERLWKAGRGRLSYQVLVEYYVVSTRKLKPGLPPEDAAQDLRAFQAWRPIPVTGVVVDRALEFERRHSLSFWDALIVSAAERLGCSHLLTEDLQDDSQIGALRILNPFRHAPAELGL